MIINIIGAGRVGKTLAKQFLSQNLLSIGGVLNRNEESSLRAVNEIGSGTAISKVSQFPNADIWMLSVSDDQLANIVNSLSDTDLQNSIIFHCSGAISSSLLRPLNALGVASIHPVKSFAGVNLTESLEGTYFTIEGDRNAVNLLSPMLTKVGGNVIEISSDKKLLYHSAMVMVSNYLTSLIFSGESLLIDSGVPNELALKMIAPLAQQALNNSLTLGPIRALTGPIQRGDVGVVKSELEALAKFNIKFRDAYAILGKIALDISSKAGLSKEMEQKLNDLLEVKN
jgi:predicted short-subunit dehydrogenase-like oxidoreductase (DUF2520 family)